jgi:CubicO group peptidase (beta-lactamase class C family)
MSATHTETYFPPAGDAWERRRPEEVGLHPERLQAAIDFTFEHEATTNHHSRVELVMPDNDIVGPLKERGPVNGLILRHGYIVAEWGDTSRVDMTYSISKSYLSTVAGLALDRGLIRDVDDLVKDYVQDGGFDDAHNAKITWRMLLQQSSEWVGTLFGKRDIADRRKGVDREIQEPGTFYEYNDVRVNRLSHSLLQVWRRPLPEVLKEYIMDPIGASDSWEWHGYDTSWVELDGKRVQSVSGGGHWGGGVWINSRDHARFGHLFLRNGRWGEQQLISERWVREATTPSTCEPTYGYMWWVNPKRALFPSAPENSYAAIGAGRNMIWISPDHDLVAVVRWLDNEQADAWLGKVVEAVER